MIVDVGPNAHSVSDHTQGNWNGVIGAMRLDAVPDTRIAQVRTFPDIQRRSIIVRVDVAAGSAGAGSGTVSVVARRFNVDGRLVVGPVGGTYDADYPEGLSERGVSRGGANVDIEILLGAAAILWDEFQPALYAIEVELVAQVDGRTIRDSAQTVTAPREISVAGGRLSMNGKPLFLRGTACVSPPSLHPHGVRQRRNRFDSCLQSNSPTVADKRTIGISGSTRSQLFPILSMC